MVNIVPMKNGGVRCTDCMTIVKKDGSHDESECRRRQENPLSSRRGKGDGARKRTSGRYKMTPKRKDLIEGLIDSCNKTPKQKNSLRKKLGL